jgi:hypothetical protein
MPLSVEITPVGMVINDESSAENPRSLMTIVLNCKIASVCRTVRQDKEHDASVQRSEAA